MVVCKCEYCNALGRQLTDRQHAQCRDEPGMFEAFLALKEAKTHRRHTRDFIGPRLSRETRKAQGPPKPCGGCQNRKEVMNSVIPKSGDAVEWVTTKTGVKDWWERKNT